MSKDPNARARLVRCPGCGKQLPYAADNPARPFCSPRCRSTDLAAWASESYRVDAPPPDDGADDGADHATAPEPAH